MPETSAFLARFHRWFLTSRGGEAAGWTVLLRGIDDEPRPELVAELSGRLNLSLDGGGKRWLAFGPAEIRAIAGHPASLALLGVNVCPKCPADGPCGRRKILRALAARGEAVLLTPEAADALHGAPRVLRLRYCRSAGTISLGAGEPLPTEALPELLANLATEWIDRSDRAGAGCRQSLQASMRCADTPGPRLDLPSLES